MSLRAARTRRACADDPRAWLAWLGERGIGPARGGPGPRRLAGDRAARGRRGGLQRAAAAVRLLLHNALRVDEACAADMTDLGADAGRRVLVVTRRLWPS
jgi:hypothetical protein